MITNANLVSCNFFAPSLPLRISKLRIPQTKNPQTLRHQIIPFKHSISVCPNFIIRRDSSFSQMGLLQKWRSASGSQTAEIPVGEKAIPSETDRGGRGGGSGGGGGGDGGEGRDWTTSILLFVFWAGLMFYVFNLAPNQTPVYYMIVFFISVFSCN